MSSSFTLAPGRLGAAGRSRGGQHAAQSRPPTPQRQSVLPGSPPDLQLSGVTLVRRVTQRSVPCKLQIKNKGKNIGETIMSIFLFLLLHKADRMIGIRIS